MPDVPSIPPLSAVADAQTKSILQPLIEGWNLRNGTSDKSFVTAADLTQGTKLFKSGTGATVSSGGASSVGVGPLAVMQLLAAVSNQGDDADTRLNKIESPEWFTSKFNELKGKLTTTEGGSTVLGNGATDATYAAVGHSGSFTVAATPKGCLVFIAGSAIVSGGLDPYTTEVITAAWMEGTELRTSRQTITQGFPLYANGGLIEVRINSNVTMINNAVEATLNRKVMTVPCIGVAYCDAGQDFTFSLDVDTSASANYTVYRKTVYGVVMPL